MSYEYSENILVQESAGNLLQELGWRVVFAYDKEVLGDNGTLGRRSYREVPMLTPKFGTLKDVDFRELWFIGVYVYSGSVDNHNFVTAFSPN